MVKVYYRRIETIDDETKKYILSKLSKKALIRLQQKNNPHLYNASLCALSLLNKEQMADLDYTEAGRPFFSTMDADISISHSNDLVAVAVSDSKENRVGVDVEPISEQNTDTLKRFAERFFTEDEMISFSSGTTLTEIWTKKEALFKRLKNFHGILLNLDSSHPEDFDAFFTTINIDASILTLCASTGEKIDFIKK